MDRTLPQHTDKDHQGDKGMRMVDGIVSDELRWIFRPITKSDLGIDAHLEMVEQGQGTGRLIAAQIKCGPAYFGEATAEHVVFRGHAKHLYYWLDYSLPVLVIICDPESGQCLWEEITPATAVPMDVGWKVLIPRKNLLGKLSADALKTVAGRPQRRDLIEVLLHRFLYEKYTRRIEVCTTFELPRDYWRHAYLAKIDDELTMIDFHYDAVGVIQVSDLQEIVAAKKANEHDMGKLPLHLYLVSESKRALKLSREVVAYLQQAEVTFFRVHFRREPMWSLDELDGDDRPLTFWPDGSATPSGG